MDVLSVARIFQLVFSVFAIIELVGIARKLKTRWVIVLPVILFVAHILVFACVYLVADDFISGIENMLYVQWSVFVRLQTVATIGAVAYVINRWLRE